VGIYPWDDWIQRLERTGREGGGKSIYVWEDGLKKAPFCILIRHVFLWMMETGLLDSADSFVQACLENQDSQTITILHIIPDKWDALFQ
jgi:hypothetical protein